MQRPAMTYQHTLFCIRRMERRSTTRTTRDEKHGPRKSAHVPEAAALATREQNSGRQPERTDVVAPQYIDTLRLGERLDNWARVMRQGDNASGDRDDARLVNAAWTRLAPLHKRLLQMHYVWGAHREFVCRRLKIRHRPWSVFELELAHARMAVARQIACVIDERGECTRAPVAPEGDRVDSAATRSA